MYQPHFVISNRLVRALCSIEASKELILNKDISEDVEKKLKDEAILQKIYHGTHIEGNELTLTQTAQILEGANNVAQNMDVQEVINYKKVFNLLEELEKNSNEYLVDWLRDIHTTLSYNILPAEKAGFIRETQVVIRDEETNEIIMTPPPAIQVRGLLEEFFSWFNSLEARDIHPVIRASIFHSVIMSIHPFVEGNSVVIRMFTNLILTKEGYNARALLSIESAIDNDFDNYFDMFFGRDGKTLNFDRDLTPIVEYFAEIVSQEFLNVKNKFIEMKELSPTKFNLGEQVALSSRQMKLLQYISENGRAVMKELKTVIPSVSEDTILRDLTALTKKGIIEKEGTTKASSYILKK